MAIQDQCNRCKKNGTSECISEVSFDGNSCESYVKKGIDLEKHEDMQPTPQVSDNNSQQSETEYVEEEVITSEWLKENGCVNSTVSIAISQV